MAKFKKIYVVMTILSGLLISAYADTLTIEPLYDMYTDPDHSGSHPATELWVADYAPMNNHQRIMIMFDLSAYMGQTEDSSFLNLDRFFGCPQGSPTHTKIYEITESWDESWPANVHISHGTSEWASYTFSYNGWHKIDITSLVNAWLNETVTNYGLVIQALPGNKWSKFYSREASSSVRPYLKLIRFTGLEEEQSMELPRTFSLIKNSPNPFNQSTVISFQLSDSGRDTENQRSDVSLCIYDIAGQLVQTLVNGSITTSRSPITIKWNGTDEQGNLVPSGIYFYELKTSNGINEVKKMILLR